MSKVSDEEAWCRSATDIRKREGNHLCQPEHLLQCFTLPYRVVLFIPVVTEEQGDGIAYVTVCTVTAAGEMPFIGEGLLETGQNVRVERVCGPLEAGGAKRGRERGRGTASADAEARHMAKQAKQWRGSACCCCFRQSLPENHDNELQFFIPARCPRRPCNILLYACRLVRCGALHSTTQRRRERCDPGPHVAAHQILLPRRNVPFWHLEFT